MWDVEDENQDEVKQAHIKSQSLNFPPQAYELLITCAEHGLITPRLCANPKHPYPHAKDPAGKSHNLPAARWSGGYLKPQRTNPLASRKSFYKLSSSGENRSASLKKRGDPRDRSDSGVMA